MNCFLFQSIWLVGMILLKYCMSFIQIMHQKQRLQVQDIFLTFQYIWFNGYINTIVIKTEWMIGLVHYKANKNPGSVIKKVNGETYTITLYSCCLSKLFDAYMSLQTVSHLIVALIQCLTITWWGQAYILKLYHSKYKKLTLKLFSLKCVT